MRFTASIFGRLLEAIDRRQFRATVERHDGDAYDKTFRSWDHLVALVFAQLSAADSLRGLEARWNANSDNHYHLASGPLMRSTLSDANRRRPPAVFAEVLTRLANQLDRRRRREAGAIVQLIDSTPIPLDKLHGWAKSNGHIRGMKLHVMFDPDTDCPRVLDITDANVNDIQIGRTVPPQPGATYVFDKGYCHYGWWTAIARAGAAFVTRPKASMKLALVAERQIAEPKGDGFLVLQDCEVRLASKGDSKLPVALRRLTIHRQQDRQAITLLTNDLQRSAVEIAALYKARWQIELLFRWIKQHLKIRTFLGRNDNAIRLQLLAALIAYVLLRLAARTHCLTISILRFTDLVHQHLFDRRRIATIDKPPPANPSRKLTRNSPLQCEFAYA